MLSLPICPVGVPDLEGDTPLHVAAAKGFEGIVRALLLYSLWTASTPNKESKTASGMAEEAGFGRISSIIRRRVQKRARLL